MNDKEIIALFNSRDQRAVTELKNKYGGYVKTVCLRISGDAYDAEECENDAYLSVWNSIPPAEPDDLGAYVFRIARNLCVDRVRRDRAKKRSADIVSISDELDECFPASESAEDEYIRGELKDVINSFLRKLKKRDRDIFLCRYYYSYETKDIASRFGLDEDYVRTVLSRIRQKLKQHLMKEGRI
ncbi:MAG: sigma-70 family RNA polymerase sigma factor [Clostridia bacterium]|nr:sigma-70 family RNA polymerase sigma factor [Clostridia bacterium]